MTVSTCTQYSRLNLYERIHDYGFAAASLILLRLFNISKFIDCFLANIFTELSVDESIPLLSNNCTKLVTLASLSGQRVLCSSRLQSL